MSLLTAMGMVSNQGTWKLERGEGVSKGLGGTPGSARSTPLSSRGSRPGRMRCWVPKVGKPGTGCSQTQAWWRTH